MSRSKKNKLTNNTNCDCPICLKETKSFFSGESLIDTQALMNRLTYGYETEFDLDMLKLLPNISDVMKKINDKVTNHFGDMEFALDEYGEPDGLKNEQEIVLTVASEVSEEIAEEVFINLRDLLSKNAHIDELAMELLKESKEEE